MPLHSEDVAMRLQACNPRKVVAANAKKLALSGYFNRANSNCETCHFIAHNF